MYLSQFNPAKCLFHYRLPVALIPADITNLVCFGVQLLEHLYSHGQGIKNPVKLKIIDEAPAGKVVDVIIKNGETVKIMTGGKVPKGADAVLRREM